MPRFQLSPIRAFALVLAAAGMITPVDSYAEPDTYVLVSWNDLGMHCMNRNHRTLSVLPPYNTLQAQVIRQGSPGIPPEVLTDGLTLEYSVPGNTYSVGKTDFWQYAFELFGVQLPPNIGLTGKGLAGEMDPAVGYFIAEGIPITPFPDAHPTTEDPYQQALIIARDPLGAELARSQPVIPVSTEMGCVSPGCHASEQQILNEHEQVPGFDPTDPPILCAACHADPALGTPGSGEAEYFSQVIHDQHNFIDQQIPGMAGCYKCHPGPQVQCLRCTMNTGYNMVCQDCHGSVRQVAESIEGGRTPWTEEPACRSCHTAQYGEPTGQLYRHSTGHGGVACAACHGSPHATFPSREPRDNANNIELQGHAGTLTDCRVCHGSVPSGPGPHGYVPSGVTASELLAGANPLHVQPSVTSGPCTMQFATQHPTGGRLIVYDAQGRVQRLLRPDLAGPSVWEAEWDGLGRDLRPVEPGVYFVRWEGRDRRAAARVVVTR